MTVTQSTARKPLRAALVAKRLNQGLGIATVDTALHEGFRVNQQSKSEVRIVAQFDHPLAGSRKLAPVVDYLRGQGYSVRFSGGFTGVAYITQEVWV